MMTMEERREEAIRILKGDERLGEVARSNPFDKFLLWAAHEAEDAVFRTVNIDDAEDCRWLDRFLDDSCEKIPATPRWKESKRHVPERNPLVKGICRQVYDELSEVTV